MTPQELLDGTLAKIQNHANAWRTAAQRIMDKPAAQRHEADRKLSEQLKALALQAEQIIAWANKQQELIAADPLGPAVRSYGGEDVGPVLFDNVELA